MSEITVGTNSTPLLEESEVRDEKGRAKEPWDGEVVKSIVYAGLEAIFTSFSLISSVSASRFSSDGISSSLGDILSTNTKKDLAVKEMAVTEWELNNHGKHQQQQLLQQYQNLGMDVNDANTVVEIFSKYNNIMRDQKMTAEKGVMSPDQAEQRPLKNGIVTFVGFGSAPLSSFIVLKPFTDNEWVMFLGASFMSAIALTLLGVAKAKISGKSYAVSVGLVLLTGAVAALAAYLLGWTLLIKVEDD